jgi:hypothetical protein
MTTLAELESTHWTGAAELWLDPLGDEAQRSDCTITVEADGIRYTWSYQGEAQEGRVVLDDTGADFTDTWHQKEPLRFTPVTDARGLFHVEGRYGPDADWGWRILLSHRTPTGELVLQMTNVAPWGEEARAVRMVCARQD